MPRLVLAGLMLAVWAGCSCSKDTNPAPAAGEAPKYGARAAGSTNQGGPAGTAPKLGALAANAPPSGEQGSVYNLPLVIKIDVPNVPEEIRGPSPPIVEEKASEPAKGSGSSGSSFWPWSGGGGKK